jgi:peptidyl-prolyl cis-trans isomerase C
MRSRTIVLLCLVSATAAAGFAWTRANGRPSGEIAEAATAMAGAETGGMVDPAAPTGALSNPGLQTPQGIPPQPAAPVPAELPSVVARVNGEEIGRGEFDIAIKSLEARVGASVPPDRRDEVFRGILDQLIGYRLLLQETKARHVEVTDQEVDARVADIRGQFPDEAALANVLKAQSKTVDDLKRETRENLVIEKLLREELGPKISVTDTDVKTFYDQNTERFQQPEAVRASHILVKVDEGASAEIKTQARTKAEGLLTKLKGGADFADVAKEHSDDGSAQQGGDLGYFTKGQMVPEFETAAFGLADGQVSGVVESPFGFHIIKMMEHRAGRTVPLPEVSERITAFLTQQRQQEATGQYVQALRAKGKVEVLM